MLFDLSPLHTFAPDPARGGFLMGTLTLTPGQASDLLGGLDYINIYTPGNLGGEIRGQLVPVPEPTIFATAVAGILSFAFARRFRRSSLHHKL